MIGSGVALVAVAAVVVVGSAGADNNQRVRNISCTVKLSKQRDPGPAGPGIDFAQITCSRPFGFGAQYDTFRLFPTGNPPSGTGFMNYRAFFDNGRITGRWAVTFAATTKPCDFNFKVVSTWTGGDRGGPGATGAGRGG